LGLKRRYAYSSRLLRKSFSFHILFKFELSLYRCNMFLLGIKFSWKKTKKMTKEMNYFKKSEDAAIIWIAFSLFLYTF
jgi:hypothetical protein